MSNFQMQVERLDNKCRIPELSSRKPRILLDQDEVLAETMEYLVSLWNEDFNDNKTIEDIFCWDLSVCLGPEANKYFSKKGFFKNIPRNPQLEEIEQMAEKYDLFIVTTAPPAAHEDKIMWIKEQMSWFPIKNVIFTDRKDTVWADVLLDDGVHNLTDFSSIGLSVKYQRSHNKEHKQFLSVSSLKEFHVLMDSLFYK